MAVGAIDVHQHLWPAELVEALRVRGHPPYLRGWTLHTDGEAPYDVAPDDHDVDARVALDREAGTVLACVSLSAPLGIESLPDASVLLDAWHAGAQALPEHFRAWASVTTSDPDLPALTTRLAAEAFVGLQLPATALLTPAAWEAAGPVLTVAARAGKPLLVHPGPARATADVPGWWPAVVDYVGQLQAAWWAWQAVDGRALLPGLRVVFGAAAGLAPVHHERHVIRGGSERPIDPDLYVDSSGYGPRALDAVVRVLGIDALVLGSDRPYADPLAELFGDAATHAVRITNPARLLGLTAHRTDERGTRP
ncbi:MAG: amidohydrolase [Nocardioides sp.]|nr:amidohydrolase [Nocardioides sp.]